MRGRVDAEARALARQNREFREKVTTMYPRRAVKRRDSAWRVTVQLAAAAGLLWCVGYLAAHFFVSKVSGESVVVESGRG